MQLNTWLPFFIQPPVFCEIFFKNCFNWQKGCSWTHGCHFSFRPPFSVKFSLKTFHFLVLGDFCVIFLLAGHGQMIVSRCCHYSSSRVLPSQGIGRSGHYNQSENSFFSSAFSLNVRNFPDVIPCCLEKRKCCSSNNIPNQKKIWQNVRWYRIWV